MTVQVLPQTMQDMPGKSLEAEAHRLARDHLAVYHARGKQHLLLSDPRSYSRLFERAHHSFSDAAQRAFVVSYAGEWLLDNYYLIQQALMQIIEDVPSNFNAELPKLKSTSLAGYPRVYAVARGIVLDTDGVLARQALEDYLVSYQEVAPLTMGELWALPAMLRVAVIEVLAYSIASITGLAEPARFVVDALSLAHPVESETLVANLITSLRMLSTQDWKTFFEQVSQVEGILQRDPADVYARMDFETRNRYRTVVERLAKMSGQPEVLVAETAVRLAREQQPESHQHSRHTNLGYYLLGSGYPALEAAVGYRPSLRVRASQWISRHALFMYLGGVALISLVVVAAAVSYAARAGAGLRWLIAIALLMLIPASVVGFSVINGIVTHLTPPRILPKLNFSEGIPPEHRTVIAMPVLLSRLSEIDSLVHQLEMHYLRNSDPQISCALLGDLVDAPHPQLPDDDLLIDHAVHAIRALNSRHQASSGRMPFCFLLRPRQWNPAEEVWMGWERKRGKLHQFNQLLLTGSTEPFIVREGPIDELVGARYVITLDADTVLPRGSAQRLVGTIAHPLNQAQFEGREVVAGYTILQPRVEILPTAGRRSRFAEIYAGDTGIDLYTRAVSDVYQDLFGEGIYVGKGLYDVTAFELSVAGMIPENALLSHDLFEGNSGRAALVTDVVLFEDYPPHYLAHANRLQRWIRGDWQLLPWLLPRFSNSQK